MDRPGTSTPFARLGTSPDLASRDPTRRVDLFHLFDRKEEASMSYRRAYAWIMGTNPVRTFFVPPGTANRA